MKELENYKIIHTDDGSQTLYSERYLEACHSTSGAREETKVHYIEGCKIKEKAEAKQLSILEVGFGVGIGLEETAKALAKKKFNFTSFEIDPKLVEYSLKRLNLKFTRLDEDYKVENNYFTLKVLTGNARARIKGLDQSFDAIYQDAFSPKRNSELWTQEWFSDLYQLAHEDCLMSTYSSSSSIRKSMIAAGWKIYAGTKFGPKRTSTRARKTGLTDQLIIEHLERSPAPMLTDKNFKDYKI